MCVCVGGSIGEWVQLVCLWRQKSSACRLCRWHNLVSNITHVAIPVFHCQVMLQ